MIISGGIYYNSPLIILAGAKQISTTHTGIQVLVYGTHVKVCCVKCQRETTKFSIRQSTTIKVFVQNVLSDLGHKREFTHHN